MKRATDPVVWIRRILLLLGISAVLALAVLIGAYRFGAADREGRDPAPTAARTDDRTITAGEGFDYTQTSEGEDVFRIRAQRSAKDREENVFLEAVTLDVFRDDGETYRVTSERARVNERTWDARLEGDVTISGWGDLELEARVLQLRHGGHLLLSEGEVQFALPPDLVGRASHLRLDRKTDTIILRGGVHVRSAPGVTPPMRLDCERLMYWRGEGLVRALDKVLIRFGDQELRTRSLALYLESDQRTLRTLRARWDVRGTTRTPTEYGGESRVEFRGQVLELEPLPADREAKRVVLGGGTGRLAIVGITDPDGLARTLIGDRLEGLARGGRVSTLDGTGSPLLLVEHLDVAPPYFLRQACATRASARFDADGNLARVLLEERVELWNEEIHLSGGATALLQPANGRIEIEGDAVQLLSDRGDLVSPRIAYTRDRGLIRASDGVRASLDSGAAAILEGTPFGQGQGPIRVESEEANWLADPASFSFLGGVRAWRDRNLLLAEQVRGDQTSGELSASGGVKTLWFTEPAAGAAAGAAGAAGDGAHPIQITAGHLTFRQPQQTVVYSEDVAIVERQRTIVCAELTVELSASGNEAKRMFCRGDVRLDDPVERRRVTGEVAVYTVAQDRLEVLGDRVELVDSQQNRIAGKYLLYDLAAGTVQIRSRVPADLEAGLP